MKNWREYDSLKKLYDSYLKGYYTGELNYEFLLKKLNVVKNNISRLVSFEKKIMKGDIDGYGCMDLETI